MEVEEGLESSPCEPGFAVLHGRLTLTSDPSSLSPADPVQPVSPRWDDGQTATLHHRWRDSREGVDR